MNAHATFLPRTLTYRLARRLRAVFARLSAATPMPGSAAAGEGHVDEATLEPHQCTYCNGVQRRPDHRLVRQVLSARVNSEGDLVDGEEWLACAGCGQPYYSLGRIGADGYWP